MRIAVLSGKGGTGKTMVSVNLAAAAAMSKKSTYIDCDVEEPNGHLFFKPEGIQEEEISVLIPKADAKLCTGCRKCVDFCNRLLDANSPPADGLTFIDCPPGSACIVMESIQDADYCVLVAEPTLFGVHNLNMVYDLVRLFNKPFGVLLNKCLEGEENPAEKFCMGKNIKILGRISFDKELGTLNSNAEIAVAKRDKYRDLFSSLLDTVIKEVPHEAAVNS